MTQLETNPWNRAKIHLPLALGWFCVVVAFGCSDGRPVPYPTKGKLLIKGKPYSGVTVFLYPTENQAEDIPFPRGVTDDAGDFQLTTYKAYDGAPEGTYTVVVIYDPLPTAFGKKKPRPPAFDKKYTTKASSPLSATIAAQDNNVLPTIEIP